MAKRKQQPKPKPTSWQDALPGEWFDDQTEFEGAQQVTVADNLVEVFPRGGACCYRFRRIKGKLVRTG